MRNDWIWVVFLPTAPQSARRRRRRGGRRCVECTARTLLGSSATPRSSTGGVGNHLGPSPYSSRRPTTVELPDLERALKASAILSPAVLSTWRAEPLYLRVRAEDWSAIARARDGGGRHRGRGERPRGRERRRTRGDLGPRVLRAELGCRGTPSKDDGTSSTTLAGHLGRPRRFDRVPLVRAVLAAVRPSQMPGERTGPSTEGRPGPVQPDVEPRLRQEERASVRRSGARARRRSASRAGTRDKGPIAAPRRRRHCCARRRPPRRRRPEVRRGGRRRRRRPSAASAFFRRRCCFFRPRAAVARAEPLDRWLEFRRPLGRRARTRGVVAPLAGGGAPAVARGPHRRPVVGSEVGGDTEHAPALTVTECPCVRGTRQPANLQCRVVFCSSFAPMVLRSRAVIASPARCCRPSTNPAVRRPTQSRTASGMKTLASQFDDAHFGPIAAARALKRAAPPQRWRRACAGARRHLAGGGRRRRADVAHCRPRHRRRRARRRARRRWTTAATARRSMLWRRRLILFCRGPRAAAARRRDGTGTGN